MRPLSKSLQSFVLATILGGMTTIVPAQSLWVGAGLTSNNTNWNNSANWSPAVVPTASSNVLFNATAAVTGSPFASLGGGNAGIANPANINNIVSSSLSIASLTFTNLSKTTNGIFQNTLLGSGVTLTTSNMVLGTTADISTNAGASLFGNVTIAGTNSMLVVSNLAATFFVGMASSSYFPEMSLDLSGLGTFIAKVNVFSIGASNTTTYEVSGIAYLAQTNFITAGSTTALSETAMDSLVGFNVGSQGKQSTPPGTYSALYLGQTNVIYATNVQVGCAKETALLAFNPALTNANPSLGPVALFRAADGVSRIGVWAMGDGLGNTGGGSAPVGTADFTGGSVNALVNVLEIGKAPAATGGHPGTGTLNMAAGVFSATTLWLGHQTNNLADWGAGTLNLYGPGTFSVGTMNMADTTGGETQPTTGTVNLSGGNLLAGTILADTNASPAGVSTINVTNAVLTLSNTCGTSASRLSALNVSGATLQLNVTAGVVPMYVNALQPSGANNVINILSMPAGYPAQYPLISYSSESGFNFVLGTLAGPYQGYLSNNVNNSSVDLVITNSALARLVWNGNVNGNWNATTPNWFFNGAPGNTYAQGDLVTFDDTLTGTPNVVLATNVAPGTITFSNSTHNYILSGANAITGSASLTLFGSGSVTLSETGGDNFSGGITVNSGTLVLDQPTSAITGGLLISGGTVQIGNNDTNGALPGGALTDNGTLAFDQTGNVTLSLAVPGSGSLAQEGSGTLTLTGVNSYTGNTLVTGGTLALGVPGAVSSSAGVEVNGATLDVSALTQAPTFNGLGLTNATVKLAATINGSASVICGTLAFGSTNGVNVVSLPAIASYPTTFILIQSTNPASGSFNVGLAAPLPNSSSGYVSQSADLTEILLVVTNGPIGVRPNVLWSGADLANADTNWSDPLNWELPGAPTPVDNVLFNNTAAVFNSVLNSVGGGVSQIGNLASLNNIVDRNFTLSTLTFTNLNGMYHNTEILPGVTLLVTNTLTIGGVDTGPSTQEGYVTVFGTNGTLQVANSNSPVQVWDGEGAAASTTTGSAGSQATLDLSALGHFVSVSSQIAVGASVGDTVNHVSGILYLAQTNDLTTTFQTTVSDAQATSANAAIVVGDCVFNAGSPSYLYLGQANTIRADTIVIGRSKSSGYLQMNPNYQNLYPWPTVTFRGFSANAVSLFDVGSGNTNAGTSTLTADANLTGGIVTAAIGTLNVGFASLAVSGSGTTTGSLEFDAGNISAGTVNVGYQNTTNASKAGVGTITVGTNSIIGAGATLSVSGTLGLALSVSSATTSGTLEIDGGAVLANTIAAGTNNANSMITLQNGGLLAVTNFMGTPSAPLATLNLQGGTLQLNVNGSVLTTNIVATTINSGGLTTINIGAIDNGLGLSTIPLISYSGSDPFTSLVLGTLPAGFSGVLVDNTANDRIDLNITGTPSAVVWSGAVNANWDFSTFNWQTAGTPMTYGDPDFVQFDDTASRNTVDLTTTVSPGEMLVTNNAQNYVFSGSGSLNAAEGFIKAGSGTLTLEETGADNFSGGMAVEGGEVIFARPNNVAVTGVISGAGEIVQSGGGIVSLSSANTYSGGTVVNSGTLQLTYSSASANAPELAAGAGPITDNGILAVTNVGGPMPPMLFTNTITGSGLINLPQNQEIDFSGPGTLSAFSGTINIPPGTGTAAKGDITGGSVSLNAAAIINVMSGGTLWVASGNGAVTVPATINVSGPGNGEGWGALRVDTSATYSGPVNLTGNTTIGAENGSSGTISGVISDGGHGYGVTKLGGATVILTGPNTYGGLTTISNSVLQIGNGVVNGTLPGNAAIAAPGATLAFVVATNTSQSYNGIVSGSGTFEENGYGGTLSLNGMNTFTNGVNLNAGALWITNAAALGTGPKNITVNNGTAGHPELHLNGISGNILLPSNFSFLTSWIGGSGSQGAVINEAGNNEIDGSFTLTTGGGGTAFVVNGGTLKLAGNIAPATTGRTLQFGGVGNGTVSGVMADNGTNVLTGVTVVGPGTWTFSGTNTYVTTTTVSGGTLLVNGAVGSGGASVQTNAILGGSGVVAGTMTVQAGGSIQGGDANFSNMLTTATLNLGTAGASITSSRFTLAAGGKVVATTLNVNGTNVVEILDSSLKIGTNTLFTYSGGAIGGSSGFAGFELGALPSGAVAHLINTGSAVQLGITSVLTVNTNPPTLGNSVANGVLTLSWPSDHLGWALQTNSINLANPNDWFTYPGSTNLTNISILILPDQSKVFYRLVYP